MPAEKGDTRNLTRTPGAAERDPAWSPDGKSIAYFSDASGEYQLYVRDQDGFAAAESHRSRAGCLVLLRPALVARFQAHCVHGQAPAHLVRRRRRRQAGQDRYRSARRIRCSHRTGLVARLAVDRLQPRPRESDARDIRLFAGHAYLEADHGRHEQRGPSGFRSRAASTLYFTASTNNGPSDAGIDLSSLDRATTSSVYVVVLSRNGASPVPPESDDENKKKDDDAKKDDAKKDEPRRTARTAQERRSRPVSGRQGRRQGKSQEEGRRQTQAHRDRPGRDRQSNSLAAHSRAQLRRPGRRQNGRAVSRRRRRRWAALRRRKVRRCSRCGASPPRSA